MASSPSGSMSNMSRLLSSSRLSTFHPKVPQVYTAPASYISRGDFGMKRPLPTSHLSPGEIRYVDIGNFDTKEGKTIWKEREREVLLLKRLQEMNVQIETGLVEKERGTIWTEDTSTRSKKGILGPRISTRFDPSTRRPLPTDFSNEKNQERREALQGEARIGRAQLPFQFPNNYQQDDPFGRVSDHYTSSPSIRLNFRKMNEKRFERYLEEIREKRESFKDHLAHREAISARFNAALRYEKERNELERKANEAQKMAPEGEVIEVQLPPLVQEEQLPILKRGGKDEKDIEVDLWDQARFNQYLRLQYEPWLQSKDLDTVRDEKSQQLPLTKSHTGGYEIPPSMHIHGGIQYSQPDRLSAKYLHNTLPARKLGKTVESSQERKYRSATTSKVAVAIGGHIASMPSNYSYSNQSSYLDTSGNEPQRGSIRVRADMASRVVKAEMEDLLSIGSKKKENQFDQGLPLEYGKVSIDFKQEDPSERLNRGFPGSRDWVGLNSGKETNFIDFGDFDALTSGTDSRPHIDTTNYPKGISTLEKKQRVLRDRKRIPTVSPKEQIDIFAQIVRPYEEARSNKQANKAAQTQTQT